MKHIIFAALAISIYGINCPMNAMLQQEELEKVQQGNREGLYNNALAGTDKHFKEYIVEALTDKDNEYGEKGRFIVVIDLLKNLPPEDKSWKEKVAFIAEKLAPVIGKLPDDVFETLLPVITTIQGIWKDSAHVNRICSHERVKASLKRTNEMKAMHNAGTQLNKASAGKLAALKGSQGSLGSHDGKKVAEVVKKRSGSMQSDIDDDLQATMDAMLVTLDVKEKQVAALEVEKRELNRSLQAKNKEVKELLNRLDETGKSKLSNSKLGGHEAEPASPITAQAAELMRAQQIVAALEAEKCNLNDILREKNRELGDLQRRFEEALNMKEQINASFKKLETEKSKLTDSLKAKDDSIARLGKESKEEKDKIIERHKKTKEKNKAKKEEIKALKSRIAGSEETIEQLKSAAKTREESLARKIAETDRLTRKIGELDEVIRQSTANTDESLNQKVAEIERLTRRIAELDALAKQAKSGTDESLAQNVAEIDSHKKRIAELEGALKQATLKTEELVPLRAKRDQLIATVRELQNTILANKDENQRLSGQVAALTNSIEDMRKTDAEKAAKIAELSGSGLQKDETLKQFESIGLIFEKLRAQSESAQVMAVLSKLMPSLESALLEYRKSGLVPDASVVSNAKSPQALHYQLVLFFELAKLLAHKNMQITQDEEQEMIALDYVLTQLKTLNENQE